MEESLALLVERLAAIEHERWSSWQKFLHEQGRREPDGSLTLPSDLVERWDRQIRTPYAELSDAEKESDRAQVRRYLPLFARLIQGDEDS